MHNAERRSYSAHSSTLTKVVVPPPKQVAEVQERLSHAGKDYEVRDFYLCLRDQPLAKKAGA